MKNFFFIILFLPGFLHSQWFRMGGPVNQTDIRGLIVHEEYLYASNKDAIARSSDNGLTWEDVSTGLKKPDYKVFLSHNGSLYTGFSGGGLYRLNETLKKWEIVNDTLRVAGLAVKDSLMLAAIPLSGVYVSSNQGVSWNIAGLPGEFVTGVKLIDKKIIASTLKNLFLTDDGKNWQQISFHTTMGFVECFEVGQNAIWLGTLKGLYRSHNYGNNWVHLDTIIKGVSSISAEENKILVGTDNGPFYSNDGGGRWTNINTGLTNIIFPSSLIHKGHVFGASYYTGLYELDTLKLTWKNLYKGSKPADIYSLALGSNTLYAVTGPAISELFKSVDNGVNWTRLNTTMYLGNAKLLYHQDKLYLGSDGVYVSTNEGVSWDTVSNIPLSVKKELDDDTLYLSGYLGAYRYSAGTGTLERFFDGYAMAFTVRGDLMFAGGYTGGVAVSRDKGKTWQAVNEGLVYDIRMGDPGVTALGIYGNKVYCSTNYGFFYSNIDSIQWIKINNLELSDICIIKDNIIGVFRGGIIYSNDSGDTWNEEKFSSEMLCLDFDDTYLYAGTATGIWKKAISSLTDANGGSTASAPEEFILRQNYPNPFNPITIIEYQLPVSGYVSIRVFDILGKEIAELINEYKTNGSFKIKFDASRLSGGVYFYQIKTDHHLETKQMLLLR